MRWIPWCALLGLALASLPASAETLKPDRCPVGYYRPASLVLAPACNERLTAEPEYVGAPQYGRLRLGNGLDTSLTVVIDEKINKEKPEESVYRVYIDANNDEDLTNDGDGAWGVNRGTVMMSPVTLSVDYTKGGRFAAKPYPLQMYRFTDRFPDRVFYYRTGAMRGTVDLGGLRCAIALIDEDSDGLYNDFGPELSVLIDRNGDGRLETDMGGAEHYGALDAFNVQGVTYRLDSVSPCGGSVQLTARCAAVAPRAYLNPGCEAPDFETTDARGRTFRLSDLKGSPVILEFFTVQSEPTPGLADARKLWAESGKTLEVVSVCLDGESQEAAEFVAGSPLVSERVVYSRLGASDPIARLYRVRPAPVPTTVLIDADGKIATAARGRDFWLALVDRLGWVDGLPVVLPGKPAPDFEAVDLDGKSFKLSDYRGKVLLIDFWATWCAPCRAEIPRVVAAYEKYHEQGLEVLGISSDGERNGVSAADQIRPFAEENAMPWRQVLDSGQGDLYGVQGIPTQVIIDRDGNVVAYEVGSGAIDHEAVLAPLFGE